MNSEHRDVYLIREQADEGDEEGWLVPEPAEDVIVREIVDATDLSREDVEPLGDHVDFEHLHDLLAGDSEGGELTVSVEGVTVTIAGDGSVTVSS